MFIDKLVLSGAQANVKKFFNLPIALTTIGLFWTKDAFGRNSMMEAKIVGTVTAVCAVFTLFKYYKDHQATIKIGLKASLANFIDAKVKNLKDLMKQNGFGEYLTQQLKDEVSMTEKIPEILVGLANDCGIDKDVNFIIGACQVSTSGVGVMSASRTKKSSAHQTEAGEKLALLVIELESMRRDAEIQSLDEIKEGIQEKFKRLCIANWVDGKGKEFLVTKGF